MACHENVIKNMANEITRNCQAHHVSVDSEFVTYIIDLLLLNPKYGKLFSKTVNRKNLAYFVNECDAMLIRGGTALNTLKIQFVIQTNYDQLPPLIDKHLDTIQKCLKPLLTEILDTDPDPTDVARFQKLYRKISIYFILSSGLGNPGHITTLKEGMAALESVFSLEELKMLVALPRQEKHEQLDELMGIVAGVRLFNRDSKKGGEGIPDLPFNLVDAGKACVALLSNSLISVMQRVNSLTTAIEDIITIDEETGNVVIDMTKNIGITEEDYREVFDLLAFNRQYEIFIRKLLADVEYMTKKGAQYVEQTKAVLEEIHGVVKYKDAVPVQNVFPLFSQLWHVWRAMQNVMYLVSIVNRLMTILNSIQETIKIPHNVLEQLLRGKTIVSDQLRMNKGAPMYDQSRSTLASSVMKQRQAEFLGFCVLCLGVGALVPSNMKIGLIKVSGLCYGFCCGKMAARFSKEPERYINQALNFVRNNPHYINLLSIVEEVYKVKDITNLVVVRTPAVKVFDKDIQTEIHPVPENKDKDYTWDLWELKRRACQWASVVKCKTHSTQTYHSHLRSEIQCQTAEPRDKCLQTQKEIGINTISSNRFLWGLRGQNGSGQHSLYLTLKHSPSKPSVDTTIRLPCVQHDPSRELCKSTSNLTVSPCSEFQIID